jgi:hypothetical protein
VAAITLSDGARAIVLENVPEERPRVAVGSLVLYTKVPTLIEIPMNGRLKTKAEALILQAFATEGVELRLTERDGTLSVGWRVKTDPAPEVRRKDGDSADYLCTFRLWRMP